MKTYTFGKETVPVAGVSMEDSILIIESVKNENYKIMLLKLNTEGGLGWVEVLGKNIVFGVGKKGNRMEMTVQQIFY